MINRSFFAIPIAAAAMHTLPAFSDTFNVPGDAPTIQVAINLAADGDTIVVAPGTYFESLSVSKQLTIQGAGGLSGNVLNALGQFAPAITISGDLTLEGFTITGGFVDDRGGALRLEVDAAATLVDCELSDNEATSFGGAIYANTDADVDLIDCVVANNMSGNRGGAIYSNGANLTIADCELLDNMASHCGGAIYQNDGVTTMTDSLVQGNVTSDSGGGMYLTDDGVLDVRRCEFLANDTLYGGALYGQIGTIVFRDSVIASNTAGVTAGAFYFGSTDVDVDHVTIVENTGDAAIAMDTGANGQITNSIVRNAAAPEFGGPGELTIRYSNIGGGAPGEGNIDVNPIYVNFASGDYRLTEASAGVDAGDTREIADSYPVDLALNPRAVDTPGVADTGAAVVGISTDMGAFEFQPAGTTPTCAGDLNGDDEVGFGDLVQILSAWGSCP